MTCLGENNHTKYGFVVKFYLLLIYKLHEGAVLLRALYGSAQCEREKKKNQF